MPSAGCLSQRILRVAKPWAFESCEARRGAAGHDPVHPRGLWWHLWGASGPCRTRGQRAPGEPQTGGSADARVGLGRGEPAPRHGYYARGPEPSCGPGPGRTPVPGRCAGPDLGGRHHLRADLDGVLVYLAVVLDVFSRRVVGWSMAHHLRTERVLGALNMALGQRRPEGVVHHSDQGSQYTSLAFGKRCREMGVLPSTGSAGDCFDNAMAESFFATLECELIDRRSFHTQAEARMAIFQFIEGWYNPRRRHSALGYLSPNDYERSAAKETPRAVRNAHRPARGVPGASQSGEPKGKTYPPGGPHRSVLGKTVRPPAVAHLRTGDDSQTL